MDPGSVEVEGAFGIRPDEVANRIRIDCTITDKNVIVNMHGRIARLAPNTRAKRTTLGLEHR